jgi:hypothetical protein
MIHSTLSSVSQNRPFRIHRGIWAYGHGTAAVSMFLRIVTFSTVVAAIINAGWLHFGLMYCCIQ